MELEDEMSGKVYFDKNRETYIYFMEDNSRDKKVDLVINRNDGGAKKREEEEEAEMNMLRRRRERLMRRRRRRQTAKKKKKKQSKSEEESFPSSDSDAMKIEEVKRVMENMNSTLKSKELFINNNSGEAIKIEEEMNIADQENMFPRTRGRLVRYLRRRLRSKPQDSSFFQIDFHHLQLPSDND